MAKMEMGLKKSNLEHSMTPQPRLTALTRSKHGTAAIAMAVFAGLLGGSASIAAAEDRTITGTGNNLQQTNRGSANTALIRLGYPEDYPDGSGTTIFSDAQRANARTVSNTLAAQGASVPNNRNLSSYIWMWGQFLTHDLDLSPTSNGAGVNGSANIAVGATDVLGPNAIPMTRSNFTTMNGVRQQTNSITTWIDASMVYGSDTARAAALRTDGGTGAKLVTSANNLPGYNTAGFANDNSGPVPANQLFLAGDVRANENVGLTSMHTVFMREHNRLVDVISAQQPTLNNEQKYQLARKIVGAEMQAVTYKEFLPALLGAASAPTAAAYVYDPQQNAAITQSFAVAAFRFGHSTLSSQLPRVNNDGTADASLALQGAFFNPNLISNDPAQVTDLLKGGATQVAQEVDTLFVDDVRNFLFGPPGAGGMDLFALNTQRGRDHGLVDYRQLRTAYDLSNITGFNQIPTTPALRAALQSLYGNIDNIDGYVGGLAENHIAGGSVGATFAAIIAGQFERLRDGDRLFYLSNALGLYANGVLSPQIASIINLNTIRLSDIIALNTGLTSLQAQGNLFFALTPGDVNRDGAASSIDIDAVLRATAGVPATPSLLDVNADGTITPSIDTGASDSDHLIRNLLRTEYGDATLDGAVNLDDFTALAARFGQPAGWAGGNFNNDTLVSLDDFTILAAHFGFTSASDDARLTAVPEPALAWFAAATLGALATRRRLRSDLLGSAN